MQVYYDLATGLFLQSPTANNEITQITAKRAANNPISIQFLNNGVPTTLPVGSQLIFGAKPQFQYDNNYAVYVDPTGWSGPDGNNFYTCNPGYNTTLLNSLFGYTYPLTDTLPHPDSVILDGEISWLVPGASLYAKTPYWTLLCYNDVSKGIEGVPTSGGPIYPAPSAIELIAHKGTAGGYAGLDGTARVPAINQALNGYDLTTIVASGTANLIQSARHHTHKIAFTAGTATYVLELQAGQMGDIARIPVAMPAGTSAALQLIDVPAGTTLTSLTNFGLAYQSYIELHMGSANWHLDLQTA